MQQESILGQPCKRKQCYLVFKTLTLPDLLQRSVDACIRALVNFPVFWHKQPLEPSVVYPSRDHKSESDHWQMTCYKSPVKHIQGMFPYQQQKKEEYILFYVGYYQGMCVLLLLTLHSSFSGIPRAPRAEHSQPKHWRQRKQAVACLNVQALISAVCAQSPPLLKPC